MELALAIFLLGLPLFIWIYLLFFRGFFWLEQPFALPNGGRIKHWPEVLVIVPARNEADVIDSSLRSLLVQDYPGNFSIILVNDRSEDATGPLVEKLAAAHGGDKLSLVAGREPIAGWVGKMWAVKQGLLAAEGRSPAKYFLFTDADIAHESGMLRQLVALAETQDQVMVSLMAKLSVQNWIERALVPAYIYFFMKLYPFAWVRDRGRKIGAAAGGCMLVQREAFIRAGGIEKIRNAIIDDCSLGAMMKQEGGVWLGLAEDTYSLRPYHSWREIWELIARSAFTQLRYSNLMLGFAVSGMFMTYMLPILMLGSAVPLAMLSGALGYIAMIVSYQPILRYYRLSPLWGITLPFIALFYMAATLHSAIRHWRGLGIRWKGRLQAES